MDDINEDRSFSYVQSLDASLCVVREDISDWLQRYLFDEQNAPVIEPEQLLDRLESGRWLARLAYKLHHTVFAKASDNSVHSLRDHGVSNKYGKPITHNHSGRRRGGVKFHFPQELLQLSTSPLKGQDLLGSQVGNTNLGRSGLAASTSTLSDSDLYDQCSYCGSDSSVKGSTGCLCSNRKRFYPNAAHSDNSTSAESNGSQSYSAGRSNIATHWVARNNVTAFLGWCKDLGIPETVLFETTGLVHHTEEKNVLLTLMEIVRLAAHYGLTDLPYLIHMEREIDFMEACLKEQQQQNEKKGTEAGDSKPSSENNSENSASTGEISVNGSLTEELDNASDGKQLPDKDDDVFDDHKSTQADCNNNISTKEADVNSSNNKNLISSPEVNNPDVVDSVTNTKPSSVSKNMTSKGTSVQMPKTTRSGASSKIRKLSLESSEVEKVLVRPRSAAGNKPVSKTVKETSLKQPETKRLRDVKFENGAKPMNVNSPKYPNGSSIRPPKVYPKNDKPSVNGNQRLDSRSRSLTNLRRRTSDVKNTEVSRSQADISRDVRRQVELCTCCQRIQLQPIDGGRYRFNGRIFYLRRFRCYVMVRVGGGWLTLEEFLEHHDPCRRQRQRGSVSRSRCGSFTSTTPSCPSSSGHDSNQATLLKAVLKDGTLSYVKN